MSAKDWRIDWIDHGREPQLAPNPAFPNGVDIDFTSGQELHCAGPLPYPAKRCGFYSIHCRRCGLRVAVSTAGRPDDPRSIKLACMPSK